MQQRGTGWRRPEVPPRAVTPAEHLAVHSVATPSRHVLRCKRLGFILAFFEHPLRSVLDDFFALLDVQIQTEDLLLALAASSALDGIFPDLNLNFGGCVRKRCSLCSTA